MRLTFKKGRGQAMQNTSKKINKAGEGQASLHCSKGNITCIPASSQSKLECEGKMTDHTTLKSMKEATPEDLREITSIIRLLVNKETNRILQSYMLELLIEPIDYVIPAIWGVGQNGQLDAIQEKIHQHFASFLESLLNALKLKDLNNAQQFAIEFLIRELFISKIVYQVERVRSMTSPKLDLNAEETPLLKQVRALGNV